MGTDHVLTLVAFVFLVATVLWYIASKATDKIKKPRAIFAFVVVICVMMCYIARTIVHCLNGQSIAVDLFMIGICIFSEIAQYVNVTMRLKQLKTKH